MGFANEDNHNPHPFIDDQPQSRQQSSLMADTSQQDNPSDSAPSEKESVRTHVSNLASSTSAFSKLLGASHSFTTTNRLPSAMISAPSSNDALVSICSPTTTPVTDSSTSLPQCEHSLDIASWRGELVFPCVEDLHKKYYDTDIFLYTDKIFRGREIRFPTATYPANEQGWEILRQDLIESARRHGYHLTSRGRDIVRNRIRLVCQQYRLYRKSGGFKSNVVNQEEDGDLVSETSSAPGNEATVATTSVREETPPITEARKRSKRPKTLDTKCRVQLSIFYKHWGDPKGYFFLKGGTGEAVHSHHARLEIPTSNLFSGSLPLSHVAKLPPAGHQMSGVDTRISEELQSHFDMVTSAVMQYPDMLNMAKQSLIELSSTVKTRGLASSQAMEGSEQEVLSSCAALSAMKESGMKRKRS